MATSNITSLRKAGRLEEAYKLAKEAYDTEPDNIWNIRSLAWCIYDYAKKNATANTRAQFLRCLIQLESLKLPQDEQVLYDSTGWLIRGMTATCCRAKMDDWTFYDNMFSFIGRLNITRPSEVYSSIMQTAIRMKNEWPGFIKFCDMWGLENFREEDFKPITNEDGKKMLSLVERVYMGYAKALLSHSDAESLNRFLPQMSQIANQHHEYIYLPYYQAKILLKLGKTEEVKQVIRPFVRKKPKDFWVWELIGDAMSEDNEKLCLYARALSCPSKIEMTINLREHAVFLLLKLGYAREAKCEIETIVKIRQKNGWNIPFCLQQEINSPWYSQTTALKSNAEFYHNKSTGAEEMVLGKKDEKTLDFKGKIKLTTSGYGFVEIKKNESVFIPASFIEKHNINNGDTISGLAEKSFDKKKEKESLKAVKIYSDNKK